MSSTFLVGLAYSEPPLLIPGQKRRGSLHVDLRHVPPDFPNAPCIGFSQSTLQQLRANTQASQLLWFSWKQEPLQPIDDGHPLVPRFFIDMNIAELHTISSNAHDRMSDLLPINECVED